MDKPKILSGQTIVAKGVTKIDASLPEIGLKDIAPNGSWLEEKQIQAALEARKHLIEVERIEKLGSLSHATWQDELKLAEVTQKVGGYWQYLGHNVGKILYLKPEEALFLMEINCLQLKHGDVIVSLQKAYSLLFDETMTNSYYRVYASLSRLGYKVFRHKTVKVNKDINSTSKNHPLNGSEKVNDQLTTESEAINNNNTNERTQNNGNKDNSMSVEDEESTVTIETEQPEKINDNITENDDKKIEIGMDLDEPADTSTIAETQDTAKANLTAADKIEDNIGTQSGASACASAAASSSIEAVPDSDTPKDAELLNNNTQNQTNNGKLDLTISDIINSKRNQIFHDYVTKLKRLTNRQYKPSDYKIIEKNFENIPDLFKKEVITINVPDQQLIPQNIFVNKCNYMLDMKEIKRRTVRSVSVESGAYNSSDEVNGYHVRRIRSNSATELSQNLQFVNNIRFPPRQTRPYYFWRPPSHNNHYVQFNMFFQRPCYPNMYPFLRSLSYSNSTNLIPSNPNTNINARKRLRRTKANHLESIKNLALKLKQLIMTGDSTVQNIESLQHVLFVFNTRYKTRIRLSDTFDIIEDENIVDTIHLDDDEESTSKKPRLSQDGDMFDENLNMLKELALKLKDLEAKGKMLSQHKRGMSKAIKTFNKSYDAEIYMNKDYEVINKRYIDLETDSESECIVNESKKVKKLRNPFNILKRRSEKQAANKPSIDITKTFNKNWLPVETDFGRAEVVKNNLTKSRFIDTIKEGYLFNFMKNHYDDFNNWLEVKIAFLQHMEETDIAFQNDHDQMVTTRGTIPQSGLKPLIDEDCLDMPSVLEKLRIIKNNKEINTETKLRIHFDVYNRDVQHFKKTNPPKPHFRIICIEESSTFPSTADVMTLHSQYEDNVIIVFAVVGSSAVSYLQINPVDLPVYNASSDTD